MMREKKVYRALLMFLICTSLLLGAGVFAQAAYSISFKSSNIEITSPKTNHLSFDSSLYVEGKTDLPEVWFCVKSPEGQLVTYPAEICDGGFRVKLYLRFGKGTYTVWAGDNPSKFDGKVRFEVNNSATEDITYTAPSAYVDSDHKDIRALAEELISPSMTDMEKIQAIHHWAASNIVYDYNAYLDGENILRTANETIKRKIGTCRDYSFAVAALARALEIPARIVYGNVSGTGGGWDAQLHAWNELYADGRWVIVDTTWDAGYIKEGRFIPSLSDKYFDPDTAQFAITHQATWVTLH